MCIFSEKNVLKAKPVSYFQFKMDPYQSYQFFEWGYGAPYKWVSLLWNKPTFLGFPISAHLWLGTKRPIYVQPIWSRFPTPSQGPGPGAKLQNPKLFVWCENLQTILPKDPDICPKKGISPIFLWPGDGIGTINLILGRGLDP